MPFPFELMVVIIVSVASGCSIIVAKLILDYLRDKNRLRGPAAGSSLTASELQRLMREAVEEANVPLRERLEALEHEHRLLAQGSAEAEAARERSLSA